ncbi:MAG: methyltransferase [Eubacterium sp.]|jgi:tRNA1Val (adenine37-N6)-methyltransferase|nr:methyltransferase [Eubacterium sp.]MCH4046681.1 methyltransferase [Eubacterium sp.]MCH4079777.1 methyltransferase [Eubacterium sp.]MCH4110337.1 methyltransferase [Eubacterium sp.]MCI1307050.1 methyltransferase [Eubacterium sp.]
MTRRVDETGFGDLKIIQDSEAFCYGVDAVLLAGFTADVLKRNRRKPERLMDLGTGNGIVPLILSHKTEIPMLHGIEFQENNVRLAEETVQLNGMHERMQIWQADVSDVLAEMKNPDEEAEQAVWKKFRRTFDVVTSNPPYTRRMSGAVSKASAKALARHETTADLSMFIELSALLLKEKGDLFMVHRPQRLVDILTEGRRFHLEAKDLQMVSGHEGEKPNIVLVHMVKGGGVELNVLPCLAVRDDAGNYTRQMRKIYEREFPELDESGNFNA